MAAFTTQAEVDDLRREYFLVLLYDSITDRTSEVEWPSGILSTGLTAWDADSRGFKPKVGTLSQKLQDDLIDLLDTADANIP
jgi:hypothetical protein